MAKRLPYYLCAYPTLWEKLEEKKNAFFNTTWIIQVIKSIFMLLKT